LHNWSFRKIYNAPQSSAYFIAPDLRDEAAGGNRKLHEELHTRSAVFAKCYNGDIIDDEMDR
jgi:hypothetical protein